MAASPPPPASFLVAPSQPTPHYVVPLTHGSVMSGLTSLISSHSLLFFPPPPPPPPSASAALHRSADIIKSAVAHLLVPYHPHAGRIVETETGWEVRSDGGGAAFIVTASPFISQPPPQISKYSPPTISTQLPPGAFESLPPPARHPPPSVVDHRNAAVGTPALVVQITELPAGGGFILGVRVCNAVFDTSGFVHFLSGWAAEMARGEEQVAVAVAPVWDLFAAARPSGGAHQYDGDRRLPQPPHSVDVHVSHPVAEERHDSRVIFVPNVEAEGFVGDPIQSQSAAAAASSSAAAVVVVRLDLSLDRIKAMVRSLRDAEGSVCSTSQILAAHVWRERVRALKIAPSADARLFFVCETSSRGVAPPPPFMGYYGAFKFNCVARANAGDLLEMPLSWAADLVRNAQENLTSAAFEACLEEFKRIHSGGDGRRRAPAEVLLFTELPSREEMERNLDFGRELGRPGAVDRDILGFPVAVNVAAVAAPPPPPPKADAEAGGGGESSINILFNNVPPANVDDLHSFICNQYSRIKSKI